MHELPQLPYDYKALEPYIDAQTLEIHHSKHHQTYVTKLNDALKDYPELQDKNIHELLISFESIPENIKTAVKNNGGGHLNHALYWLNMAPEGHGGGGEPAGKIKEAIDAAFGNFETFKEQFSKAALNHFASGWGWLVSDKDGKLKIYSTPDHVSPVSFGDKPILILDVWEHAYYLKYQNKRVEYIDAWWRIVNWGNAEANLENQ